MPYSHPAFDKQISAFISKQNFKNYLDVGSGAGKYGRMIRELIPDAVIIGVEAEKSYINQFHLKDVYTKIHHLYIEEFIKRYPDFQTELVIIGDCLEHLKKSDGMDLIHYLAYRTKYVIIIYPTKCIQYSWQGHATEAHRSVWSSHDFEQFNHKSYKKGIMNMVIMNGYIGDPDTEYVED